MIEIDDSGVDTPILTKDDIVRLEEPYDLPERIRCAIVSCRQPHKRGYFALLRDGTLSRIGHDCGKRLLGEHNFVLMRRDLDKRRARARREQYIRSPDFDPGGALASLAPWDERVEMINQFIRDLGQLDANMLAKMQDAVKWHHGELEYWDTRNRQLTRIQIQRGKVLELPSGPIDKEIGWQADFVSAKTRILKIIECLEKDEHTDDELKLLMSQIGEAQWKLRMTAEMLDEFDAFCGSITTKQIMSIFFQGVKLPRTLGPVDRTPINKLDPGP